MFDKLRMMCSPASSVPAKKTVSEGGAFWAGCAGGEDLHLAILLQNIQQEMPKFGRSFTHGIELGNIRAAQQPNTWKIAQEVPAGLKDRYFRQNGTRFRLVRTTRRW